MKIVNIVIIVIVLCFIISCSFEDYEKPVYNVEVNNPFLGISINTGYNITLENTSSQIIIEINYTINDRDYTIIDDIVPKQKVILLGRYDEDIICTITGVTFY